MTKRRRFSADFKARVALEALRGDKTIQEIAVKHKVHPNQGLQTLLIHRESIKLLPSR